MSVGQLFTTSTNFSGNRMHKNWENTSESDFLRNSVNPTVLQVWSVAAYVVVASAAMLNLWNLISVLYHDACNKSKFIPGRLLFAPLFYSDFLASAIFYPLTIYNIAGGNHGAWNDPYVCQTVSYLSTSNALSSAMCTCRIAVVRTLMASQTCLSANLKDNIRRIIIVLIVVSYSASILIPATPYMQFALPREIDPPYGFCGRQPYRLELWLQPLKFAMMVFFPMTIAMLCYCKVYVILWSRQKEFLKRNLLAISVAARAEARARPLGNKRRSKSLFTNGSRYRLGRSPGAREHTSLRRRRSSVISPLVLMKNKQRKEMRRLRSLARRIVWMVVIELFAHYPIALFYLLRSDDNPRPMTNLLVLVMHFSVAFFNSIVYGHMDPQMKEAHFRVIRRVRETIHQQSVSGSVL